MTFEADDTLLCDRCGTPLGDDPDDQPTGGAEGGPICGECDRNRNDAVDFESDMLDGSFDGMIDL